MKSGPNDDAPQKWMARYPQYTLDCLAFRDDPLLLYRSRIWREEALHAQKKGDSDHGDPRIPHPRSEIVQKSVLGVRRGSVVTDHQPHDRDQRRDGEQGEVEPLADHGGSYIAQARPGD